MTHLIKASDIQLGQGKLSIFVRRSETDQKQKGRRLEVGFCSDKDLCLVEATQEYLRLRDLAEDRLFCHQGGSSLARP